MTQRELGEACGLGQSAIGNYEAGLRAPSMDVAQRIVAAVRAKGVSVSIEDIFKLGNAA